MKTLWKFVELGVLISASAMVVSRMFHTFVYESFIWSCPYHATPMGVTVIIGLTSSGSS